MFLQRGLLIRSVAAGVTAFMILVIGWANGALADLFVSAAGSNAVARFDDSGNYLGNFVAPNSGGLTDPQGIAFGPDGNLYVSSHVVATGQSAVLRFNGSTGAFIDVFAQLPSMVWPAEINFRGGHLYVSDFSTGPTSRVSRFDLNGNFVDHFATGILGADGQSWNSSGDLLVSSFFDSTIKRYDSAGVFQGNFVSGFSGGLGGPLDNLLLPNGELLVSSFNTGHIKHYASDGTFIGNAISGLSGPQGLELGPDGLLYVGEFTAGRIRRYNANDFSALGVFANVPSSTSNNFTFSPTVVPEPTSGLVLSVLVAGIGLCAARRRQHGRSSRL